MNREQNAGFASREAFLPFERDLRTEEGREAHCNREWLHGKRHRSGMNQYQSNTGVTAMEQKSSSILAILLAAFIVFCSLYLFTVQICVSCSNYEP